MSVQEDHLFAAFLRTMTHDELRDELTHGETLLLEHRRHDDRDLWTETAHMVDAIEEELDRRTQWKGPLPVVEGSRL